MPAPMLPEVRPSSGSFGETVAFDGIPAGVPIAVLRGGSPLEEALAGLRVRAVG